MLAIQSNIHSWHLWNCTKFLLSNCYILFLYTIALYSYNFISYTNEWTFSQYVNSILRLHFYPTYFIAKILKLCRMDWCQSYNLSKETGTVFRTSQRTYNQNKNVRTQIAKNATNDSFKVEIGSLINYLVKSFKERILFNLVLQLNLNVSFATL